ncbi:hypothetical protein [Okeania sp. KiyG1]|uniref:hypothetical protein n=1 Tax=Okeania sp. KiyG1 TaxID=2720165 RepID=UPI001924C375|nr:hypothetical protein [Okeania sp. KiyG1]
MKKEEGRRKKEEGRRKKEEGRRKKEEGRRKKEEKMDGDSNLNQLSTLCRWWGIKPKIKR